MISAVIVAAGSSRRMGFDKLAAPLGPAPVLAHSLGVFSRCASIGEIIVVTAPDRLEWAHQLARDHRVAHIVPGGAERHLSVWNGIRRSSPEYPLIAVHDGARPLVTPDAIRRCAEVASDRGAATLAHRVVDTLKRSLPEENTVAESVSRENLWAMETPQIFLRDLLLEAYQRILAAGEAVTDEVSAVQATGHQVFFVENPDPNPKITVPSDLSLAALLLDARSATD